MAELLTSDEFQRYLKGLMAVHFLSYLAVKIFRPKGEIGQQPHVAAHFPVSLGAFAVLALLGTHTWVYDQDLHKMDRLHGYSEVAITISRFMTAFQFYELFAIIMDKSLAGPGGIMALHHIVVIMLGTLVVTQQYMHYYSIFFFGVPELSSLPLAFVDLFKSFRGLREKNEALNGLVRNIFALTFLPVRDVWFPIVSFKFWVDSVTELGNPDSSTPIAMVIAVCASNFFMVCLQVKCMFFIPLPLTHTIFCLCPKACY